MSDVIVQMHIYAGVFAHHALDGHEVLVHPVEVTLLVPDVAIHLFLKRLHVVIVESLLSILYGFLHERIAANIYLLGIVGAAGKGRVNVNQINLNALLLQIGAS